MSDRLSLMRHWLIRVCPDCGCTGRHGEGCMFAGSPVETRAETVEVVPADAYRGAVEDGEELAHAVSASLEHGEQSPLATALSAYLKKHPWTDL